MSQTRKEERWWDKIREILISDGTYEKVYFEDEDDRELIRNVMEEGGTLSLDGTGKKPQVYHVHFPYYTPVANMTPLPMCSCPSYRFQSFTHPLGACKHIQKLYEFVDKLSEYRELPWQERSTPLWSAF